MKRGKPSINAGDVRCGCGSGLAWVTQAAELDSLTFVNAPI